MGAVRQALLMALALIVIQAGFALAAGETPSSPPKYGPPGAPYAAPLAQSHGYFQSAAHPAPDFWKLIGHYQGQEKPDSCSVAAVAMVMNAIARTEGGLKASDANFRQDRLLEEVRAARWKERVTAKGWEGRKGLTLAELEEVTAAALKTYGLAGWTVSRRAFEAATPQALGELRGILAANEASADDFVIVHFLQDKLTDDPGGPYAHISPVGAYDAASDRVLILDVDREYYSPYWVGLERLLVALSSRTAAYGHGGLLIVRRVSRGGR